MLIAMVTMDTPENGRAELTKRTFYSLCNAISFASHRLAIVDNGSTDPVTLKLLDDYTDPRSSAGTIRVIRNETNIGTAKAINQAWRLRRPDEIVAKLDNDVTFGPMAKHWPDLIEDVLRRNPALGILGLKRKDLDECPGNPNRPYASTLEYAAHRKGMPWRAIEVVEHVMGTCCAFQPDLIEAMGGLRQPGLYGMDDADASYRAHLLGFRTAFLCNVDIDHIDPGGDAYCQWKIDRAAEAIQAWNGWKAEYAAGAKDIYEPLD